MAPKRLLLEGPAIEPLLEKVWAEHGSDVTIVKAERVRVGGVAGFFAREQFEVTVEVPDTPLATTPAPPPTARAPRQGAPSKPAAPSAPTGIDALLAAAEQADAAAPRPHQDFDAIFTARAAAGPVAPSAVVPSADDADPWVDAPLPAPPVSRPQAQAPAADLAERLAAAWSAQNAQAAQDAQDLPAAVALPAREQSRPAAPAARPPVDDEPPTVTEQQAPWSYDDDDGGALAGDSRPTDDPWATGAGTAAPPAPARPLDDPEPGVPETVSLEAFAAAPVLLPEPEAFDPAHRPAPAAPGPPRRVGRSFARLPGGAPQVAEYALERSAVLRVPETPAFAPSLSAAAAAPAPVLTSLGLFPPPPGHAAPSAHGQLDPRSHVDPRSHLDPHGLVDPYGHPAPALLHAPAPPPVSDHDRHLPERLADLGVPAAWLWDLPLERSRALRELSARIGGATSALAAARRRTAPVAEPVVVVLADLEDALPVALHLATGMGLDEVDVVVAGRRAGSSSGRLAPSRLELQDAVADAREVGSSLVVVLPAPVGAAPAVRAAVADTLEVVEADEVWAVVDATRRLDDTAAWLAAVAGDRGVDALALVNAEVTSAPAAALGLPAPVVLVGDRPASPQAWVSLLAARLAEQDLR